MTLRNNARYSAVARGMTATFDIESRTAKPYYPTVSTVTKSNGADEGYAMLGSMPGMREWVGEREYGKLRSSELTLVNKHYESGLEIERTDIDDDRLGFLSAAMGDLAQEAATHPDQLLFTLENAGQTTACWDGQFFYDTDHLWGDSGSQSNLLTVNVVDPAAVTPAEMKSAFNQALIAMMTFKRDNGQPWIRPTIGTLQGMRISCPTAQYESCYEAFNQQTFIETRGSSFGASHNVHIATPTVDVVPYLDAAMGGSDTAIDVHYTGGMMKPFLFQLREALRRETKGINSIEDKAVKFMTEARYNVGYLAWFYSVRILFT